MRLEDITPVILTFNEAPNISRCLEKLSWAREVIVLDSFSTDGTPDLAGAHGNVRLSQRKFDDHTSQWNHAVSLAKTSWVLTLDADYILSDGFRTELETLHLEQYTAAWFAEFRYCVFGRELRASLYPPRAVLFRRDICHYVQDGHTQRLEIRGTTKRMSSVIRHDDHKPLSVWLQAQGRYAELEARHLLETPKADLNRVDRIRRWILPAPALVFLYTWRWKGLIFDGWPGWFYVMQRTIAELLLSLHLVHLKLQGGSDKGVNDISTGTSVHLVIPVYSESGRIGAFLEELCQRSGREGGISILVVDDGSGAEEQARMKAMVDLLRKDHLHLRPLLMLPANLGKGGAVHAGWKAHQGEGWLGFVDADGACTATETMRLTAMARGLTGHERALFASRSHLLGHRIERHWHREFIGRMHSLIVSVLLGIPVHDSQCGLKLVPRRAYDRIVPLLQVEDFGFDIELLSALVDSGCPVEEVPIDWHEVGGGKLRLFRDAWKMFCDILKVRQRRKTAAWRAQTRLPHGHESTRLAQ